MRRVRLEINMSVKDRLESLMLSRRSVSDLSIMKLTSIMLKESKEGSQNGAVRLRMRLPKVEVEKLKKESKDEAEVVEKIMNLCRASNDNNGGREVSPKGNEIEIMALEQKPRWEAHGHERVGKNTIKGREARISTCAMPVKLQGK